MFSAHDANGQWAMRLRISPGYGIQVTPTGVNPEGEQVVTIGVSDLVVPTILPADASGAVVCTAPYQFRFTADKGGIEVCEGIGGKRKVLRFDSSRAYADGDVRFVDGVLYVYDASKVAAAGTGGWVKLNINVTKGN